MTSENNVTPPNERWQKLITVARQAPVQRAALSDFHAASLAAQGVAAYRQQQDAERVWRGMATAAALFLACMIGLGALATTLQDDNNFDLKQTFAQVPSNFPNTSFIPAPPRPPPIAASVATHMAALSPTALVNSFNAWMTPSATTLETNP